MITTPTPPGQTAPGGGGELCLERKAMKSGKDVSIKLIYSSGGYSRRVKCDDGVYWFLAPEDEYGVSKITGEVLGRDAFFCEEDAAIHCEIDRYLSENHHCIGTALWGLTGGNMHILRFPRESVVILGKTVPMTADEQQVYVVIHVTEKELQRYIDGSLVQDAFLLLDKEEREFIVSGLKPEKCGSMSAMYPVPSKVEETEEIPF